MNQLGVWVVLFSFFSINARSAIIDEIPVNDLGKLYAGQVLEYSVGVSGSKYPANVFYQLVPASAEEVAAVSFDYELQPQYFAKLTYAKIRGWESKSSALVDYTIKLSTFLPAVSFTNRNTISKSTSIQKLYGVSETTGKMEVVSERLLVSYQNDSVLVNASAINHCDIRFRVEPNSQSGKAQSLVAVKSWIEPALPISLGTLRDGAADMFSGLIQQVASEKRDNRGLLELQLANLRTALEPNR